MRTGYVGSQVGGSMRLRLESMTALEAYVRSTFKQHEQLRSALFSVAQYWADEADDAVHASVVFSERETPAWPHHCSWERDDDVTNPLLALAADQCDSCGDYGYLSFDDNGSGITAFQSCCREGASQESSHAEAYLPYALVRRGENDEVELEIIGGPVRAWLDEGSAVGAKRASAPLDAETVSLLELVIASPDDDAPRAVLADHLQQVGDPLGLYLALSLAPKLDERGRARKLELEGELGRMWLGPLADIAPPERVEFHRGFVRGLFVHLADEAAAAAVADAREWATVRELWFLPESFQRLSPAMRSLRSVGPLNATALDELSRLHLPVQHVHVALQSLEMLQQLATLDLPALRVLGVGSTPGGPGVGTRTATNPFTGQEMTHPGDPATALLTPELLEPVTRAPFWKGLDELVVASVAPEVIQGWVARARGGAAMTPRTLSFVQPSATGAPAGFRLRVTGAEAIVDMPELGSDMTLTRLAGVLAALPSSVATVSIAPSRWFDPSAQEIEVLAAECKQKVVRLEAGAR